MNTIVDFKQGKKSVAQTLFMRELACCVALIRLRPVKEEVMTGEAA